MGDFEACASNSQKEKKSHLFELPHRACFFGIRPSAWLSRMRCFLYVTDPQEKFSSQPLSNLTICHHYVFCSNLLLKVGFFFSVNPETPKTWFFPHSFQIIRRILWTDIIEQAFSESQLIFFFQLGRAIQQFCFFLFKPHRCMIAVLVIGVFHSPGCCQVNQKTAATETQTHWSPGLLYPSCTRDTILKCYLIAQSDFVIWP